MGQAAEEQSKYLQFCFRIFLTIDKSDISTHLQFSLSSVISAKIFHVFTRSKRWRGLRGVENLS